MLHLYQKKCFEKKAFENIVRKNENPGNPLFLFSLQYLHVHSQKNSVIWLMLKLFSPNSMGPKLEAWSKSKPFTDNTINVTK